MHKGASFVSIIPILFEDELRMTLILQANRFSLS